MPPAAQKTRDIQLLATLYRRPGEQPTKCRFLVDHSYIKYGEIGPNVFEENWDHRETKFTKRFPAFPVGDWNYCRIQRTPEGLATVAWTESRPLGLSPHGIWHRNQIDYFDLTKIRNLSEQEPFKEDKRWLVRHPTLQCQAMMKVAQFPGSQDDLVRLEAETLAYKMLDGKGITPRFLGHVMEGGRAIGFLVEWLDGAQTPGNNWSGQCVDLLQELYHAGIVHGDPHPENFLLKDNLLYIIGFGEAKFEDDASEQEFEKDRGLLCNRMDNYTGAP